MPVEAARSAREELRSWYLDDLQPRVAQAASKGVVDPQAAVVFHAALRKLLGIPLDREAA
jgi:hypothetical protein